MKRLGGKFLFENHIQFAFGGGRIIPERITICYVIPETIYQKNPENGVARAKNLFFAVTRD